MRNEQVGDLGQSPVVVVLDLLCKVVLLAFLVLVVIDPGWGNLEGKAPIGRALTYPMLALVVPVWWAVRRSDGPYPWLADLLLTYTGFSDILGNRLDLYDRIVWFDDWMHFANTACIAAALVLLTMHRTVSAVAVLDRSIALGMTVALGWESWEYFSFVTHSTELPTAYGDTIGDLVMGWFGTVAAALMVHLAWRPHMRGHRPVASAKPVVGVLAEVGRLGEDSPHQSAKPAFWMGTS